MHHIPLTQKNSDDEPQPNSLYDTIHQCYYIMGLLCVHTVMQATYCIFHMEWGELLRVRDVCIMQESVHAPSLD